MNNQLYNELNKYEQSDAVKEGIILILDRANNKEQAIQQMIDYLNSNEDKSRDSLIRYAYKLIGKEIEPLEGYSEKTFF